MGVSKHILIIRRNLPVKFIKFQALVKGDRADFLGQILLQWGYVITEGMRLPSELGERIPYLVTEHRGKFLETDISLAILKLDSSPRDLQEVGLERILTPHGFTITWE